MNLAIKIPFFNKVSFLEKLLFTKHLAVMIKAGIPITEALDSLVETKSSSFKKIIKLVTSEVQNGQTLAKALSKYPQVFDQFYISMVQVGESSGTLEENLEFLAQQLSKDYNLRQKIRGAMLYPTLVFAATFVMGGFISLFILPKLVDFFSAFEVELPLSTKILLFFANFMKNYGVLLFAGFLILIITARFFLNLPIIKKWWHSQILKLPLFGDLIAYGQLAQFSRNLGILLKSGLPVVQSLQTTAEILSNLKFRTDLLQVAQMVSQGKNIGAIMVEKKYPEFPDLVNKMISVGEKTGKLEDSLLYLGDFYEDEIDNITKNLSIILEPVLLIVIGLVVGFVALAIISPIYELTGSIGK